MKRHKRRQKSHRTIIAVASVIVVLSIAIVAYIYFSTSADAVQTGPTTVSVVPASTTLQNAEIGQTIEVYINITNVRDLWGWELDDLTFNPNVLNLTQVQEGPFLKTAGPTFFLTTLNATNWLQEGILPSTNEAMSVNATAHGSGVVLNLTFAVVGAGTSPISINGGNSTNNAPAMTLFTNHEIEYVKNVTTGQMRTINCEVTNGQITVANIVS